MSSLGRGKEEEEGGGFEWKGGVQLVGAVQLFPKFLYRHTRGIASNAVCPDVGSRGDIEEAGLPELITVE